MKLQPVSRYRNSGYPTRHILDSQPELLRVTPRRWHTNAAVLAALTSASLIIATRWAAADDAKQPSRVAPIFTHGEGQGVFGCVAVNPPVILSEDEARYVVVQELAAAGLKMTADVKTLPDLIVGKDNEGNETKMPLVLDGTDEKTGISYEFVSATDQQQWNPQEFVTTVYNYNTKGTAENLGEALRAANPGGNYGIFYDPMSQKHPRNEQAASATLSESRTFNESTLVNVSTLRNPFKLELKKDDDKSGGFTVLSGDRSLQMTQFSNLAVAQNKMIVLPVQVETRNYSIYVPLQTVANFFGLTVKSQEGESAITVSKGETKISLELCELKNTRTGLQQQYAIDRARAPWESPMLANEAVRQNLREQVTDFLAWLKAEEVI